jgi:hypothetical protein
MLLSTQSTSRRRLRQTVFAEALAAVGAGLALAVAMTWPALRNPTKTIPHDLIDSALMGWELRWGAFALLHNPTRLFDGNAFHPERDSYAFSDTLFGYWPLGLLGEGPAGAALAINLVYVLAFALPSIGGYALARQLGANRLGAAVAGLAIGYAPWRLTQLSHLHIISSGGILLSLAMLARGHGFSFRAPPRPPRIGWIVAGWLVAAWQMTIGFGIGLSFAYLLFGICILVVVRWWRRGRPPLPRAMVVANLVGGLVFTAASAFMAVPYLRVVEAHPNAQREIGELWRLSPLPHGLLIGPGESVLWHNDPLGLRSTLPWAGEMVLLPGFALILLAVLGLGATVWPRPWPRRLGIGVVITTLLALGLKAVPVPLYLLLYPLPGWNGLRTPGRLVLWTTILLALLAAGAVTAVTQRAPVVVETDRAAGARTAVGRTVAGWSHHRRRLLGAGAAALVLIEGLMIVEHLEVPPPPAALTAAHAQAVRPPLLVLPSDPSLDALIMLWSTDGFPAMVNGLSGFTPASLTEIRDGTHSFPDAASIELLRRSGVRSVVVLRDRIPGTPWAGAATRPVAGLGITRTEIDDAVVYSLD